jgi:hypothetical protein
MRWRRNCLPVVCINDACISGQPILLIFAFAREIPYVKTQDNFRTSNFLNLPF